MDSPVAQAAAKVEAIKKIPLPTVETFEPPVLSAAAAAYAIAVRKKLDADRKIEQIKAEQLAQESRLAVVEALLARIPGDPIDVWCATYSEDLQPGTEVVTLEVPGHWLDDPQLRTVVMDDRPPTKTVVYNERSLNLAPGGGSVSCGQLHFAESLTDAAIYYNLAMEPGHERWRPLCRYGILQTDNDYHKLTNRCTVLLNAINARNDDASMPLDSEEERTLVDVPIVYPPCNGRVFGLGNEVLVWFEGQQRQSPTVIGFRREPVKCPRSWQQIL